jgi:uncharacterized protein YfaS (alpha-2-macroglobulin family)
MLQGRQNDQGGFGLWSSSPETAEFATIYAVHFLVEAKDRGQKLPPDVLSAADEWLTKFAASPASSLTDGRQRAYAVYLLARQGIKPSAALANVEQELSNRYPKTWQGDLAAAYLAATYRLMQRNDDAERIFKNVPWSAQKREWEGEIYYDTSVHDAQLLYLLAKHFPGRLNSVPAAALEGLADAVNDNKLNSLSAAYMLLALDSYAKAAGTQGKLSISAVAKDGNEQALTLPAGAMPKVNVPGNAAKVRFTKEGRVAVYYALNESGFDRNPPTVEMNHGVEIVREYLDIKGNPVTQVKVGEEFLVRLRLRATQGERQPQIAVVDLLPGGVEAVLELHPPADTSAAGVDPAQTGYSAMPIGLPDKSDWNLLQHVDVRDDRVVLYGDITKDAAAFVYRVRATNAGVFQTPPAFAEGMYDRKISGISLPGKLEIVKP